MNLCEQFGIFKKRFRQVLIHFITSIAILPCFDLEPEKACHPIVIDSFPIGPIRRNYDRVLSTSPVDPETGNWVTGLEKPLIPVSLAGVLKAEYSWQIAGIESGRQYVHTFIRSQFRIEQPLSKGP